MPSPVIELSDPTLRDYDIRLFIKRDDLIHPGVSGNKYRKLKYNLLSSTLSAGTKIASMGGAYSNHLYSLSILGQELNLQTYGFVAGSKIDMQNPTLKSCTDAGMQLFAVNRSIFRILREDPLRTQIPLLRECVWIPEGGTNKKALAGCEEIISEILENSEIPPVDYYCVPVGSGGTIAGMAKALKGKGNVVGFAALKNRYLESRLEADVGKDLNWMINYEFHFGGIARFDHNLVRFINKFFQEHTIQIDPIYTGKMFYGIFEMVKRGAFERGSVILAIHTGGLQGIRGFNQRFGDLIQTQ